MYNCFDIANEIMKLAKQEDIEIQPMKLLKLTYISHGWHLGFFSKPLISNSVEAWKYGPVIPELYHVIKRFGSREVDPITISLYTEKEVSQKDAEFIKSVWNAYKGYSGLTLSSKTHMDNTPWKESYNGEYNKVIPNSKIEEYYKRIIDERRK